MFHWGSPGISRYELEGMPREEESALFCDYWLQAYFEPYSSLWRGGLHTHTLTQTHTLPSP